MGKRVARDLLITVLLLAGSFGISLVIHMLVDTRALIPSVFVLAVFLISLLTDGYFYGIGAALISVLAVNFAFTFPYFEFNFTIHANAISAVIMLIVTAVTSTLTTKLKRQEMLKMETEKEKMRANLLRAISHDLRTPLTTIYGTSSTIIENYEVLSDVDKILLLQGISEDSQWLIRMVENLLSITKIDNSNVKLIKSSTALEELIDASLSKFKKRYPEKRVELTLPENFIAVAVDPLLVEQVIVNLLENAVQHAKGLRHLKLSVTELDTVVRFSVIDDGCGIQKDKLKELFSGSYAGNPESAADSSKQFRGIGLSVCATIIKAHGGEIRAENLESGGACFTFTLEKDVTEDE